MSNARLPGSLGLGPTPRPDFGTLALVASPLPGVIGLDDPMVEWAKRQLRRGVEQGFGLGADAAETAAMPRSGA